MEQIEEGAKTHAHHSREKGFTKRESRDDLMDEQAALHEAIERLYATFVSYPLHHPVIGCPGCVSRADQERIASKALRQLNGDDLEQFAWNAIGTWGDENDFRHFLPRLLELISDPQERRHLPDLFVIFDKLSYCKRWPKQEQEAITTFLLTFWRSILAGHPGREEDSLVASAYLEAMLGGIDDFAPYLHAWRDMCMSSSLRQLSELIRISFLGLSVSTEQADPGLVARGWHQADAGRGILRLYA